MDAGFSSSQRSLGQRNVLAAARADGDGPPEAVFPSGDAIQSTNRPPKIVCRLLSVPGPIHPCPRRYRELLPHLLLIAGFFTPSCSPDSERNDHRDTSLSVLAQGYSDTNFGVHCAETCGGAASNYTPPSYQPAPGAPARCGWKGNLLDAPILCDNFSNSMSQHSTELFYSDVASKAYYWEDTGDGVANSLEKVDLFFSLTHGQAGPHPFYKGVCDGQPGDPADGKAHATWAMWNNLSHARSEYMKLGQESEGRGLSFFAVYSCETGKLDQYLWSRWANIFSGGLRVALAFSANGLWCHPRTCPAHFQHGANFAYYLGVGRIVARAWLDAFDDNDGYKSDVVAIASGPDLIMCYTRLNGISFRDFRGWSRVTGSNLQKLCTMSWIGAD